MFSTLQMAKGTVKSLAVLFAFLAMGLLAQAESLTIGTSAEPSSLDPQYHNLGPNNAMARHFFDRLIHLDKNIQHNPGLAVSWKPISDTAWEFKLRKGVKFTDGSPFTAADFVYTVERVPTVPNSPSSFGIYTKAIKKIETPDAHTLILHTAKPYPLLPADVSLLNILSRSASTGKYSEQLNTGDGLVGTGPYKFVSFKRGDRLIMERNEGYWGEKPVWDKVTWRTMTNASSRLAALLAGDVDLIDQVPTADIASLRKNSKISLSDGVSSRVIYLHIDHDREISPHAKGPDGKNPLRDWRVRHAIRWPSIAPPLWKR